jgi:SNF2 family DNA or RNA helicase
MHILISADDMGLGKTLTMISLVLKAKEESKNNDVVEEDADSEKAEEGEILCSKYRKCKYHYLIQVTNV